MNIFGEAGEEDQETDDANSDGTGGTHFLQTRFDTLFPEYKHWSGAMQERLRGKLELRRIFYVDATSRREWQQPHLASRQVSSSGEET
ncbi:unnamed protein product, partial [Amoebophrya sp. A25]